IPAQPPPRLREFVGSTNKITKSRDRPPRVRDCVGSTNTIVISWRQRRHDGQGHATPRNHGRAPPRRPTSRELLPAPPRGSNLRSMVTGARGETAADTLWERVEQLRWYHAIELEPGRLTPGWFD